jgi:hypothetical protein
MRRYFDGYLPMSATLKVSWPENLLQVKTTEPAEQPGVVIQSSSKGVDMQITFAGRFKGYFTLEDRRVP